MQTVTFKAGDTILTEGEDGSSAFLIVDGAVEVSIGDGESARTVGTLGVGDIFGEMSLIEPGPRSATVRATADTECVVTTYDEFMASIENNPERAVVFMKTLVNRLRQMNALMASAPPTKRSLRQMFRDWQKGPEESDDANWTEEEKAWREEMRMIGYWGAF